MFRKVALGALAAALAGPALACPAPPQPAERAGGPFGTTVMSRMKKVPAPRRHVPVPDGPIETSRVRLERTECFGTCPAYTLELNGDGTGRFVGTAYVLTPGEHVFKIDPEAVRCLVDGFRAADFWSLPDEYAAPVTDLPSALLTLEIGGQRKSLRDYAGRMVGLPPAITGLEDAVDTFAEPWVAGDASTVAALEAEGFDFTSPAAGEMLAKAAEVAPDPVVLALLAHGAPATGREAPMIYAEPARPGEHAVALAAGRGRVEVVRALVARGAFETPGAKEDALMRAAGSAETEAVREILKSRPDVNYRTEDGDLPLTSVGAFAYDDASRTRRVEVLRLLLAAGADPRLANQYGWTALHRASDGASVRALVGAGAPLEARDDDSRTPLLATYADEVALALLEAGADPEAKDKAGVTILRKARENKWSETLAWLSAHRRR